MRELTDTERVRLWLAGTYDPPEGSDEWLPIAARFVDRIEALEEALRQLHRLAPKGELRPAVANSRLQEIDRIIQEVTLDA